MEEKKKCPFCQSDINAQATVCPFCGRGISFADFAWGLIGSLMVLGIGLYLMHLGGLF